jgi:hypothetical protein
MTDDFRKMAKDIWNRCQNLKEKPYELIETYLRTTASRHEQIGYIKGQEEKDRVWRLRFAKDEQWKYAEQIGFEKAVEECAKVAEGFDYEMCRTQDGEYIALERAIRKLSKEAKDE